MNFYDEKDYIMRIIKEMVRVIFSLMLGKQYASVELPDENKYEISGQKLEDLLEMIDNGQINEAENILLSNLDYTNKSDIIAATLFYQHLSEQENEFLLEHNYSKEEVWDGLKQLAHGAGCSDVLDILAEISLTDSSINE